MFVGIIRQGLSQFCQFEPCFGSSGGLNIFRAAAEEASEVIAGKDPQPGSECTAWFVTKAGDMVDVVSKARMKQGSLVVSPNPNSLPAESLRFSALSENPGKLREGFSIALP